MTSLYTCTYTYHAMRIVQAELPTATQCRYLTKCTLLPHVTLCAIAPSNNTVSAYYCSHRAVYLLICTPVLLYSLYSTLYSIYSNIDKINFAKPGGKLENPNNTQIIPIHSASLLTIQTRLTGKPLGEESTPVEGSITSARAYTMSHWHPSSLSWKALPHMHL